MQTYQKRKFETTCTECGKATTVPFKPTAGKPVYCRTCYSKHMPRRSESRARSGRSTNVSFDEKQAWARRGDGWEGRDELKPSKVNNL